MNPQEWISWRQARRTESFDVLEELEGFKRLSETQQRMIRMSLFVQDRAGRATREKPEEYAVSHNLAENTNCRLSAYCVENEIPLALLKEKGLLEVRESYGQSGFSRGLEVLKQKSFYESPPLEEVQALIEKTGFPAMVMVGMHHIANNPDENWMSLDHAFIALGKNSKGQIIGWEKYGMHTNHPFCLRPLAEVYDQYCRNYSRDWGVRPLRHK